MKIQYLGSSDVEVAGIIVAHGDVVDLPDDIASSLLTAGSSYSDPDENGHVTVTPPASPIWATPTKAPKGASTTPADAGKES